jgi:small subunit ribosomal protein S18
MTRKPRQQKMKPSMLKKRKKKHCYFCVEQKKLDYKDLPLVRRFMTDRGKIAPRRMTGCCTLHQRMVGRVIMRVRQMGLVPYTAD